MSGCGCYALALHVMLVQFTGVASAYLKTPKLEADDENAVWHNHGSIPGSGA